MAEDIANEDYEISATITAGPIGLIPGTDVGEGAGVSANFFTDMLTQSTRRTVVGDVLDVAITTTWVTATPCPYSAPPATYTFDFGNGTINATAVKATCGGFKVAREGDLGICIGQWSSPPSNTWPCQCTLKIESAGQVKASAN